MASIRTAIELQDNFTGVLYQVIDSVNLGLSAMEDLHQAMDLPASTASFDGARDSINRATMSVQGLIAAMQQVDGASAAPSIQWQAGGAEVFSGSGMERFRQEAQSMNAVLGQLSATQDAIARQAYNANVLPPAAFRDLNSMAVRVDALKSRIQELSSNPVNMGTDAANAELERLRGQLGQAVQEQQALNQAVDCMDVQAANAAYLRLDQIISGTERHIRDNADGQGRFNQEIQEGEGHADRLVQAIKGAVAAYATVQTASRAIGLSDTMAMTEARLNMLVDVDDGGSVAELQDMIFLSAERARASYQATADAVSKMGLMAGNAFSGTEEVVAFMEQINKKFAIAGTEASGMQAAMLQLTQAMGSGVLRGEEYNSILEQAPNIIQNIAGYIEGNEEVLGAVAKAMGMKVEELAGNVQGNLKDIAGEGLLSAELVKAAMFYAADETNEKFESMPKTFGQVWTSFQNDALMAFQPVLERMNEVANSEAFQAFAGDAIGAVSAIAGMTMELFGLMAVGAGMVADNWSWLSPIIYGVAAALAVYYSSLLGVNAIEAISSGIHFAMAAAQMIHAAATGTLTAATAAEIAAQNGLNAALYACPVVWILILIIALVAAFYAGVAALNKFAGTSISATGVICGAFMAVAAFIGNLFVTLINFVIDVFVTLWNFIAAFANFFGNVLNDPVGAIARLFFDLVDCILGLLEALASAIDTIFGSNLAGAVSGWRDSLGGWVDDTFGQGEEIMEKINAEDYHLDRLAYGEAWDAGNSFGEGLEDAVSDFDPASLFDADIPDPGDYPDLSAFGTGGAIDGIGSGVDDIAGNTGAIADAMEISEEELKYMRDLAEQETINRFTTAKITIDQSGMQNTIKNKDDFGSFMTLLTDSFGEAVEMAAEGVHR